MNKISCTVVLCTAILIPSTLPAQTQTPAEDRRDYVYYPGDTENVVPLGKKLLSNIWLDQKAIWTSPFHVDKEEAAEWLGLTAVTAALVVTDRRTSKVFENSSGQVSWGNHVSYIGSSYTLIPEVAGFYLYGVLADNQKARETGVLGGEALIDSLIVVEVLKTAAGRNRPNATSNPGDFFQGGASFPSGHSIASWALASVIAREYGDRKWVPYVAYGLAAVVGGARYAARQHYASDIFAGSAMGFFIGRYVENTHEAHAGHRHGRITPILQPSTRTFGVGYSFGQ
ncbi:MAG TPA: phosphatase PAP2 family protein [Bryobacteraceae bacterium]|nr:phosphatase PAP2 family protein [Bryobacteraceae bacterium]